VLKAQIIGSACITLATFAVSIVVMYVVNAMGSAAVAGRDGNLRHGFA
jgi:hypothetical protein